MVIDFHTHNFPDVLAPRAIASMLVGLEDRMPPVGDGTVRRQLQDMTRFGVDVAVCCPIATRPKQAQVILERAKRIRDGEEGEEAARRIWQLASVHPDNPDAEACFRAIREAGIPGIKVHPYYQGFVLNEARMVRFFSMARDAGLFVMSHCGLDLGYMGAPMTCGPAEIVSLLKAVPGLRFVAAHLGGSCGNAPHCVDPLLEFENCFFDTAVLNCAEEDEEAQRIMATWPAERLLFGTDYFWRDEARLMEWARRYRPDPAEQELIFHANAERLWDCPRASEDTLKTKVEMGA